MSEDSAIELSPALLALARIPLGRIDLAEVLSQVARIAHDWILAADGCSVRLVEQARADLTAVTTDFVDDLERSQQELAEGPGLSAIAEAQPAGSGSLGGERRWPRFGPRAGRAGVHSALSLPLPAEAPLGAITLYAKAKDAFSVPDGQAAAMFADSASVLLHNAQVLDGAGRLAERAHWAVGEGAAVERAVGILMSRRGIAADEALTALRELSQRQNVKLVALAAQIVDEAARRARGRIVAG